eukprot:s298_g15.t1
MFSVASSLHETAKTAKTAYISTALRPVRSVTSRRSERVWDRQLQRLQAVAAIAAAPRACRKCRAQSEALWVNLLKQSANKLNELSEDWKKLEVDACKVEIDQLKSDEESFRELLKRCPWGDPSTTAFAPQRVSRDVVVSSHGLATRAIVECELSRAFWELRKVTASDDSNAQEQGKQVRILSKAAIHHLRLLEIEKAHNCLTRAYSLSYSWSPLDGGNFDMGFLEYTTKLVAAKSFKFPVAAKCSELELIRQRLREVKYTEAKVLSASGALSLTELSRGSMTEFEKHLSEWREDGEESPEESSQRSILVDLVLVFLLHKAIPSDRLHTALGQDVFQILLDQHVLCKTQEAASGESMKAMKNQNVLASVALWPVGMDLVLATDFESTCFSDSTEPAMYLSQDSIALMTAAPRRPVHRLLDLCCGCGIQGLMALQSYAEAAVFVDVNPRCLSFASFNLSLNGLRDKCECLLQKDIRHDSMPSLGTFDAILANPPFMPNPQNIATGASLLFGNGGDDGEDVFSLAVSFASKHMRSRGHFVAVSKTPNIDDFPKRLRSWWTGTCEGSAQVFRGPPVGAQEYMPTAISSGVEPIRYQQALREQGISSLSQIILFIMPGKRGKNSANQADSSVLDISVSEASEDLHKAFWLNVEALQEIRAELEKSTGPPLNANVEKF